MTFSKPILIVGGGIGGLAAAVALQRIGFAPLVLERATEIREVGAGITIWSNAVHAVRALGLFPQFAAVASPARAFRIFNVRGELLSEMPMDYLEAKLGAKTYALHRAELQTLLFHALPGDRVILGAEVKALDFITNGIRVTLADGREFEGAAIVGADGLHSVTRRVLYPDYQNVYQGYRCWRGIAQTDVEQNVSCFTTARGCQFGWFPLTRGRVYWFGTQNFAAGVPMPDAKTTALEVFGDWHEVPRRLIAATEPAAVIPGEIYDRDPKPMMGKGRLTLLGDAAHASTPNLGQGACQALEDAVVLAASLRDTADIESGLRTYEKARVDRTNGIVRDSRKMGALFQLDQPFLEWLRDMGTKYAPLALARAQIEKPLKYRVPDL